MPWFSTRASESDPLVKEPAVWKGQEPGTWSSGTCDCCSDCTTCCAVFFCGAITTGQLYQRTAKPPCVPNSCAAIAAVLITLAIASLTISIFAEPPHKVIEARVGRAGHSVWYGIWGIVDLVSFAIVFMVVWKVRSAIRRRDRIPGNECEDCSCSFFCAPCTQCMLLRHEGARGGNYSLCSPVATLV